MEPGAAAPDPWLLGADSLHGRLLLRDQVLDRGWVKLPGAGIGRTDESPWRSTGSSRWMTGGLSFELPVPRAGEVSRWSFRQLRSWAATQISDSSRLPWGR